MFTSRGSKSVYPPFSLSIVRRQPISSLCLEMFCLLFICVGNEDWKKMGKEKLVILYKPNSWWLFIIMSFLSVNICWYTQCIVACLLMSVFALFSDTFANDDTQFCEQCHEQCIGCHGRVSGPTHKAQSYTKHIRTQSTFVHKLKGHL